MSYEVVRSQFSVELFGILENKVVNQVLMCLDSVMENYEVVRRETSLALIDGVPQELKTYIAVKKLAGLSDSSLKLYYERLRLFFESVHKPVAMITTNDIRLFLASYQQSHSIGNRSLDKFRMIIHNFFVWCVDDGYLEKNPCKPISQIRYEVEPKKALTRFELELLRRKCATPRELAIVDVLYSTGIRVSELCNIKMSDINTESMSIHIIGKGKKHNTVYLNAAARLSLESYINSRKHESEWLFCRERGSGQQLNAKNVQDVFKTLSKRLGIHITPHTMRHTFATLALQSGMKIQEVQKCLAHSNISTTQIYAETLQDSVEQAHRRFVV